MTPSLYSDDDLSQASKSRSSSSHVHWLPSCRVAVGFSPGTGCRSDDAEGLSLGAKLTSGYRESP